MSLEERVQELEKKLAEIEKRSPFEPTSLPTIWPQVYPCQDRRTIYPWIDYPWMNR